MPDTNQHSVRPGRLREMAEHIASDYPASGEDLRFLADELEGLLEQLEALRAVADHHIAEAERSEKYAEDRDLVAQRLEEQLEAAEKRVAELEAALREILNEPFGDVPLDAQAIACRALGGGEV